MEKRGATPEEREACLQIYKRVMLVLHGHSIDEILNTLCFVLADVAVDELDVSKQVFIANVVEQVSSAYDTCLLGRMEPKGNA